MSTFLPRIGIRGARQRDRPVILRSRHSPDRLSPSLSEPRRGSRIARTSDAPNSNTGGATKATTTSHGKPSSARTRAQTSDNDVTPVDCHWPRLTEPTSPCANVVSTSTCESSAFSAMRKIRSAAPGTTNSNACSSDAGGSGPRHDRTARSSRRTSATASTTSGSTSSPTESRSPPAPTRGGPVRSTAFAESGSVSEAVVDESSWCPRPWPVRGPAPSSSSCPRS